MDDTPNLKLPYIVAAQAQKHVTHNEAIRALDALVQVGVADRDLSEPPSTPAEGDRYIVGASASGDWEGGEGLLAAWQDGAWMLYEPLEGWLAWIADEDVLVCWDGSDWVVAGGGAAAFSELSDAPSSYAGEGGGLVAVKADESGLEFTSEVALLGINATADTSNKLAVAADATLFNHAGSGHQHKINKNAAGDTASLLFQTGFSGRAEFGTTGDDDWHVKVSPDGSTWYEAIVVDKDNGRVGINTATPQSELDVGGAVTIKYSGDSDKSLLTLVASGSSLSNSPAFLVTLPPTGGRKGFQIKNGADSFGWASFEYGVGGTDKPGLALGPGGSSARDTNIYRDASDVLRTDDAFVCASARVGSYSVAGVPSASARGAGAIIFISNETGGAVLAFSDGSNWRRVTDRAVIS